MERRNAHFGKVENMTTIKYYNIWKMILDIREYSTKYHVNIISDDSPERLTIGFKTDLLDNDSKYQSWEMCRFKVCKNYNEDVEFQDTGFSQEESSFIWSMLRTKEGRNKIFPSIPNSSLRFN